MQLTTIKARDLSIMKLLFRDTTRMAHSRDIWKMVLEVGDKQKMET
jgi:hypothetical protein